MKVITINSTQNVFVYGTAYTQSLDKGNKEGMNINPSTWVNTKVLIKQGIFDYPEELASWESVKSLEKAKVLSIGASYESDEKVEDEVVNAVKAKETADTLEKEEKATTARKAKKRTKLEELAESQLDD